ncbi:glycosyltransferase family 4 protein [Pseudonocardia sp.]|uniref:glycosyltransferase family 4 protein n=1 Tax=Pseudonocardia sp. TaxID=60912 RepID=UPI003D146BB6
MAVQAVRALVDAGHSVTVIAPGDGPLAANFLEAGARFIPSQVPVLRKSDLSSSGILRLVRQVARSIPQLLHIVRQEDPQVIYINTIVQPWWMIAALLTRRKQVVHVREAESNSSRIVRTMLHLPLLGASRIICNSRATASEVSAAVRGLARRTVVIYNGKDWSPYLSEGDLSIPQKSDSAKTSLTVVGRLSPRKGQDLAIRAAAMLQDLGIDVDLSLVGDTFAGYEWFYDELRSLAQKLGMADRVKFLGFQHDIIPTLRTTDIAIVPSRIEPFGTVAAESMAAGVLTIVANVQGLIEIVTDRETGLTFEAGKAESLAQACVWAIKNAGDATRIAIAGQESVPERFSLESYKSAVVSVLEKVQ